MTNSYKFIKWKLHGELNTSHPHTEILCIPTINLYPTNHYSNGADVLFVAPCLLVTHNHIRSHYFCHFSSDKEKSKLIRSQHIPTDSNTNTLTVTVTRKHNVTSIEAKPGCCQLHVRWFKSQRGERWRIIMSLSLFFCALFSPLQIIKSWRERRGFVVY